MKNLLLLIPMLFTASLANAWEVPGVYTQTAPHTFECRGSSTWCMRDGNMGGRPSVGDRIQINQDGKAVSATIIAITHSETLEPEEEIPVEAAGMYQFDYELAESE